MPQHQQEHESASSQARNAKQQFDGGEQAHLGRIRMSAHQIVHDMQAQQIAVHALGDVGHQAVANEATDGQSHEEMVERHELLQVNGERGEEDGIAKRTQERGHHQRLQGQTGEHQEVHGHLIAEQQAKAYGEQARVRLAGHLHPPQAEETACDASRQRNEVEPRQRQHTPVHNGAGIGVLQHLGRGVHHLGCGKHQQDRHQCLIAKGARRDVRMAYVEHAPKGEHHHSHLGKQHASPHPTVGPVVMFAIEEDPNGHKENASTVYGVGDDCAVMHYPDKEVLVTTDMLMEGVHFDLTYIDLQHLGYKSAMVNISDIFAMNGTPRQMVVSIALSKRFKVEDIDEFYKGLRMACDKWSVDIVGGDTTSSYTGLAISITCIGEANKEDIVYRSGAKETDLICVTGDLGGAYMGLQLLEREKAVYYGQVEDIRKKIAEAKHNGDTVKVSALNEELANMRNFQPDFAGKEYLLQRQLQPEARGDIIAQLREAGIRPTAMMDISDGLSSELMHICEQSHCGCRVYEKNIPIDYQTAVMAEEFNMNLTTCAMNGGEDYELLFTVPIGDHAKIEEMEGVKQIGYITQENLGKYLITRDGQEFELKAQGWNPLKD